MKFTYENQGAITYLVCELEATEQLDTLTLGMLTNNHIAGFAPVLYTEMNGQRYLKYNISAKVTADQFFTGSMNKQRALTAFQNILSAICSADDYMIDLNSFLADSEHIYLNVSSCETAMICIPVVSDKDINAETATLFKKIMFSTQFDSSEDASYITQLITYINSGAAFTVYGLKDLVSKLQSGAPVVSQAAPAPAAPQQIPVQPAQQPVVSASPFDSTISIDDMPAMMAKKQQVKLTPPEPQNVNIPTVAPVQPPVPPQPQTVPQTGVPAGAKPVVNVTPPVQTYGVQQRPVKQQPAVPPQPPVQKGPGFAIPGQPMGGAGNIPTPPAAAKKQPPKTEAVVEKKMSLFGLLSHYNKENAELYKKQKEEEKARKAAGNAKTAQKPATPPANVPGTMPGQQPPVGVSPMGVPAQPQQYTPPQCQPPVRPVPVQNSFNETTVLSPSMIGGETTVLSANAGRPDPTLTRIKTGERISINKPVFRIGKEKSYVDYFIGDNTAISRSHANIHTDNGEYFIEDTNSTNHTYVNGKLINSNIKVKLVSGDKVKLANEDFTFSI